MANIKKSRVLYLHLWLTTRRQLIITFRRFRTSKNVRSKKIKQWVIPIYLLPIKEIAVKIQPRRYIRPAFTVHRFFKPKSLAPFALIAIGVGGILYFGLNFTKSPNLQPAAITIKTPKPSTAQHSNKGLNRSEPIHMVIPAVGIDADVGVVGRKIDESMEVPENPHLAGWYKYSPTPGEIGPSIIVGHVDNIKIGPAVFWRLRELKAGDEVQIKRADGKTVVFKVTGLEQYDQNSFPTEKVYGDINHAGLRLITCGGTFDPQAGHYTQNTVVYAEMAAKQI